MPPIRFWPLVWIRLLRAQRTTTSVGFLGIGIVPDHRGTGANAVM